MKQKVQSIYGNIFENDLLDEICEIGIEKFYDADSVIMDIGSYVKSMPLLLKGVIKIMRNDEKGDELLLYFLEIGDTCAMTLTCCMGQKRSEIRAIAETDVQLIMIPIEKMESWTSKYKSWRNFVFQSYHERLLEMLDTIDSIAFMNMDKRLVKYLTDKAKVTASNIIKSTHQEIAFELNTSRVVISRLLKSLENKNLISLERNTVTLNDAIL